MEQAHTQSRRKYFFTDQIDQLIREIYLNHRDAKTGFGIVFAKPRSMDAFLALYIKITKDDIRRNRNNAAEGLGFLGRVIHGTNPKVWLGEVRQRIGEKTDFAAAMAE